MLLLQIFNINSKAKIYTTGETSFPLPEINFNTAYETIPKTIPFAIEYVRGIIIIVKKCRQKLLYNPQNQFS